MASEAAPHLYCPQCGYDLAGQQVQRCPECNFHYDVPALNDLLNVAFHQTCGPYIRASRFLAPACVMGFAALLPSFPLAIVGLSLVFLIAPATVQAWILRGVETRWTTNDIYGLSAFFWGAILLLFVTLFIIVSGMFPKMVAAIVAGSLVVAVIWLCVSLVRHAEMMRNNQVRSLGSIESATLQRAQVTTWFLICMAGVLIVLLLATSR